MRRICRSSTAAHLRSATNYYERLVDEGKLWGRKVRVLALWKRMLEMLFETGHPWMTWKDPANVRNPQDHAGVIHNSNLCTEIELNTSSDEVAVCNLAASTSPRICGRWRPRSRASSARRSRPLMRMLDNVIDINFYPVEPPRAPIEHRPVGLGVMGLQDALYDEGIAFDSAEAVAFNDEALEAIAYYAYTASSDLAAERGAYPSYPGLEVDRGIASARLRWRLLEKERGVPILVDRNSRLRLDRLSANGSRARDAELELPRHRADRHHLEHPRAAPRASSRPTNTSTPSRISAVSSSARTTISCAICRPRSVG